MKQKWFLTTGTALMLAAALAGCGKTPAADQQQSNQLLHGSYLPFEARKSIFGTQAGCPSELGVRALLCRNHYIPIGMHCQYP